MPISIDVRAAALAVALLCVPAAAKDVKVGYLVIQHPWTRATPGGAQVAGGYVTIRNRGTTPDRLTGGSFAASTGFELHTMTDDHGIMRMRPAGPIDIPAGGTVTLSPSAATHVMLTGLRHGLTAGGSVAGTLHFDHAGEVPVTFTVEAIGARAPSDSAMPGMDMQ